MRIDLCFVIVTLGRGRKDAANQRGLKFEILKRSDRHRCAHPDQRYEATNETEDKIDGLDGPIDLVLLPRLNNLTPEERLSVHMVVD